MPLDMFLVGSLQAEHATLKRRGLKTASGYVPRLVCVQSFSRSMVHIFDNAWYIRGLTDDGTEITIVWHPEGARSEPHIVVTIVPPSLDRSGSQSWDATVSESGPLPETHEIGEEPPEVASGDDDSDDGHWVRRLHRCQSCGRNPAAYELGDVECWDCFSEH